MIKKKIFGNLIETLKSNLEFFHIFLKPRTVKKICTRKKSQIADKELNIYIYFLKYLLKNSNQIVINLIAN